MINAGQLPGPPPARLLRPASAAARIAFGALLLRDITVLRKELGFFLARTLIQPFLLVFVFLYVFPQIGQGVGSGESGFATVLVAGVVGLSIMFQGIQAVALPLANEFGYTKEIEDRVLAPLPVWMVAAGKITAGAIKGFFAALIVFPIASVIHARGVHPQLTVHWAVLVTLISPRKIPVMFSFIVLPMVFLRGTYYPWVNLAAIKVWGFPWLQALVCLNPLIYITEGFRAALTTAPHMPLYVIYPVFIVFIVLFSAVGLSGFKRRVIG